MYLMSPAIPFYGPLVPRFAQVELGAKRIAIVKVKDDWGLGVSKATADYARANGMTVVAEVEYAQGDRDFKSHMTAVKAQNPDVIILNTHYTEGAILTKQARELGLTVPIVAQGTNVYPQYAEIAGATAEGALGWVDFLATLDDPGVKRAVAKFQAAYGKPPLNYHVTSYDGVHGDRRRDQEGGQRRGSRRDRPYRQPAEGLPWPRRQDLVRRRAPPRPRAVLDDGEGREVGAVPADQVQDVAIAPRA